MLEPLQEIRPVMRNLHMTGNILPEGFARKTVADWIHASEEDYLTILETLGCSAL